LGGLIPSAFCKRSSEKSYCPRMCHRTGSIGHIHWSPAMRAKRAWKSIRPLPGHGRKGLSGGCPRSQHL